MIVVLVGASGAGKSTWAREHFRRSEIVSSDDLRAVVGTGEHDLDASTDAFAVLDQIVSARVRRGLTVVIDTLGTDTARRRAWLALAREYGVAARLVVFDTAPDVCRARNRARDVPVPALALTAQLRRVRGLATELALERWDDVLRVGADERARPAPAEPKDLPAPAAARIVLQLSRFPWGDDPGAWVCDVATRAAQVGFGGVALMDHLIQIPQVGRAWEPIPEAWVTLGLLAGLPTGLQLGTLVSPLSMHAPGRLAKAAATLDVLSGGRAFVGVGAGWWEREHLAFGLPFPRGRVTDLEHGLEIMRALWAPGTKPAAGLPETTSYPRPVGALPLIVGGRGERLLRVAARLGDACNVPAELEHVDRAVSIMAGKRVTVLDIPVIGADREHAGQLVERLRGRVSSAAYAAQHHAGVVADHVARYRELAGHGVDTVFLALPDLAGPDDLDRLAPLTAAWR